MVYVEVAKGSRPFQVQQYKWKESKDCFQLYLKIIRFRSEIRNNNIFYINLDILFMGIHATPARVHN